MNQLTLLGTLLLFLPFYSHAVDRDHLRGNRYCEIIVPKKLTEYAVYNTWGLNDCPAKIWNQITVDCVKKEMDTTLARLNGPRYWVIDGFENTTLINPKTKTICGLMLREAGILNINLSELLKSKSHYKQRAVTRTTTWIYQANKPVYELIDPTGTVFVMQSYSVQQTPQTEASLSQLGTQLELPDGWQFKTGVLKKTELLKAINNQAIVIQDNFLNTYQMATHDFLNTIEKNE